MDYFQLSNIEQEMLDIREGRIRELVGQAAV